LYGRMDVVADCSHNLMMFRFKGHGAWMYRFIDTFFCTLSHSAVAELLEEVRKHSVEAYREYSYESRSEAAIQGLLAVVNSSSEPAAAFVEELKKLSVDDIQSLRIVEVSVAGSGRDLDVGKLQDCVARVCERYVSDVQVQKQAAMTYPDYVKICYPAMPRTIIYFPFGEIENLELMARCMDYITEKVKVRELSCKPLIYEDSLFLCVIFSGSMTKEEAVSRRSELSATLEGIDEPLASKERTMGTVPFNDIWDQNLILSSRSTLRGGVTRDLTADDKKVICECISGAFIVSTFQTLE